MPQPPKLFINTPQDVLHQVAFIKNKNREHMVALYLNSRAELIKKQIVSIGSLNQTILEPRDIFCEAVKLPCLGLILVHNHPSADPTPSEYDVIFTKTMVEAGKILGITLADHLIVTKNDYFSFQEKGII